MVGNWWQIQGHTNRTVSVERNIYFDKTSLSVSHLEGEEEEKAVKMSPDSPSIQRKSPSASTKISAPDPHDTDAPHVTEINKLDTDTKDFPIEQNRCLKCTWKPTQRITDILTGTAVSSNLPKSHGKLPPGVQLPSINPEVKQDSPVEVPGTVLKGKGTSDWIMAADFMEEYAKAAE